MQQRGRDGQTRWRAALALALLGGALGCFTGDGFEDRQCVVAEDCNPTLDIRGERFACIAGLCERTLCGTPKSQCIGGSDMNEHDGCLQTCHAYTCGDGVVTELAEGCDDGNREDEDGGCDRDCRKIAVAIGSGPAADHVCAISEGQVRCWGRNGEGQLARGSTANLGDEPNERGPGQRRGARRRRGRPRRRCTACLRAARGRHGPLLGLQ